MSAKNDVKNYEIHIYHNKPSFALRRVAGGESVSGSMTFDINSDDGVYENKARLTLNRTVHGIRYSETRTSRKIKYAGNGERAGYESTETTTTPDMSEEAGAKRFLRKLDEVQAKVSEGRATLKLFHHNLASEKERTALAEGKSKPVDVKDVLSNPAFMKDFPALSVNDGSVAELYNKLAGAEVAKPSESVSAKASKERRIYLYLKESNYAADNGTPMKKTSLEVGYFRGHLKDEDGGKNSRRGREFFTITPMNASGKAAIAAPREKFAIVDRVGEKRGDDVEKVITPAQAVDKMLSYFAEKLGRGHNNITFMHRVDSEMKVNEERPIHDVLDDLGVRGAFPLINQQVRMEYQYLAERSRGVSGPQR